MRTTLTLDDDVAAMLHRLQKSRGDRFKDLVNEALRAGLRQVSAPPKKRKRFQTASADLGPCLLDNVDNIAEALAEAEGELFK
jgi:hypothetical protein